MQNKKQIVSTSLHNFAAMEFMLDSSSNSAAATSGSSSGAVPLAKKSPSDFLKQVIGKPVMVKLSSGVCYKGVLACLDGFMNIAMEQTEEYVDGQLKNKYGDCFIRGNNGELL
jgi:U6 snRNA-associated Sm-like protein LSm6